MGNFTLTGILLTLGFFLTVFSFLMTQIDITNPFTGQETSVFSLILDWIIP